MNTEASMGARAGQTWVQTHILSLTSSMTFSLSCLINDMGVAVATCISQGRSTVLTNNPSNLCCLKTYVLFAIYTLGEGELCSIQSFENPGSSF